MTVSHTLDAPIRPVVHQLCGRDPLQLSWTNHRPDTQQTRVSLVFVPAVTDLSSSAQPSARRLVSAEDFGTQVRG
jgi:hypothetical protein